MVARGAVTGSWGAANRTEQGGGIHPEPWCIICDKAEEVARATQTGAAATAAAAAFPRGAPAAHPDVKAGTCNAMVQSEKMGSSCEARWEHTEPATPWTRTAQPHVQLVRATPAATPERLTT